MTTGGSLAHVARKAAQNAVRIVRCFAEVLATGDPKAPFRFRAWRQGRALPGGG